MKCQKCGLEFEGKFCPECGTPAVQEPVTQYDKYKKPLKNYVLSQIVISVVSFIFVLLLLFVPIFSINFEKLSESEIELAASLPKVADTFESWLENVFNGNITDLSLNISLYDEIVYSISSISYLTGLVEGLFQIFVAISLVMYIIMLTVSCVKNISGLYSFDNYAINLYDDIKTNADTQKKLRIGFTSPLHWLSFAAALEIVAIVFAKALEAQIIGYDDYVPSYLIFCNGVSVSIVAVIIAAIIFIAVYAYGIRIKNRIKTDILREDYGISKK